MQSALLEVMAERQVSIGGTRYPVPSPFLVLATQNPIESEGVYPLPEAQRDRFLMKINVDYPTAGRGARDRLPDGRRAAGRECRDHHRRADPAAGDRRRGSSCTTRSSTTSCASSLATRNPAQHGMPDVAQWVSYGASPRASLGLIAAGRAIALLRGRDYVLPQDVLDVAIDVLPHRMVLSYDAIADGVPAAHAVRRVLQTIPLPQVAPRQRAGGPPAAVLRAGPALGHRAAAPDQPAWERSA